MHVIYWLGNQAEGKCWVFGEVLCVASLVRIVCWKQNIATYDLCHCLMMTQPQTCFRQSSNACILLSSYRQEYGRIIYVMHLAFNSVLLYARTVWWCVSHHCSVHTWCARSMPTWSRNITQWRNLLGYRMLHNKWFTLLTCSLVFQITVELIDVWLWNLL